MPRLSNFRLVGIVLCDVLMFLWGVAQLLGEVPLPWPDAYIEDAHLHAICMLDDQTGWTVGDRGAIWHTKDGGRSWVRQRAPVGCTLYDVDFADENHGCVVGGYSDTYGFETCGVALFTKNGGETWECAKSGPPPQLGQVVCVNAKTSFAAGSPSVWDGCGIFRSDNGGVTWQSTFDRASVPWAIRLHARTATHFAGDNGFLYRIQGDPISRCETSDDGGRTWREIRLGISAGARIGWRAAAGASQGQTLVIVGNPGSMVMISPDRGQSWRIQASGQTLPLSDIQFTSKQIVWAVGALGTILKSTDAGQEWKVSRAGGRHLGAMAFFATEKDIALEVISGLSLGLPFYSRVVLDHLAPNTNSPPLSSLGIQPRRVLDECQESIVNLGGTGTEVLGEDPVTNQLRLACSIRAWRPSIALIGSQDDATWASSEFTACVSNSIHVASAGDTSDSDLLAVLDELQLPPISRPRIFHLSSNRKSSESRRISTSSLAMDLNETTEALAERAGCNLHRVPYRAACDWWYQASENGQTPSSLLRAIGPALRDGRQNRRQSARMEDALVHAEPAVLRDDTSRALIARFLSSGQIHMRTHEQLQRLTQRLPPEEAARLALHTAEQFWIQGETKIALEIWESTANGDDKLDSTQYALRILTAHSASAETEHLRKSTREKLLIDHDDRVSGLSRFEDSTAPKEVVGTSAKDPSTENVPPTESRLLPNEKGNDNAQIHFARLRPTLQQLPEIQLVQLSQRRKLSSSSDVQAVLRRNAKLHSDPAWRMRFLEELAVADGGWERLTHRIQVPTTRRPHLDGKFDDSTWEHGEVLQLPLMEIGSVDRKTQLQFGRDDQYFYIGVQCEHLDPQGEALKSESVARAGRVRDPDLAGLDRIELLLDVDRDHMTRWSLSMAHDGQVSESFEGNPEWNPRWYVASNRDETHWRIEAAIALTELGIQPHNQDPWLLGVRREDSSGNWTAWPNSAGYGMSAEHLGYLLFSKQGTAEVR